MIEKRKYNKGTYIISDETRKKMSSSHRKFNSEETKLKMSLASKGKPKSEEHKKNLSLAKLGNKSCLGRKLSDETKIKIGLSNKGEKRTLEMRRKLSKSLIGRKFSEEHRKKFIGKNNGRWLGGKSFEPYNIDWTTTLKRSIKERDNYTCIICGKQPEIFHVHHIDYDKKNCNPTNLITLCISCHAKTNINREYWLGYFKKTIEDEK